MNRKEELINSLTEIFRDRLSANFDKISSDLIKGVTNEERFAHYSEIVANYYCIQYEKMMSKTTRQAEYRQARQVLWWFVRTGDTYLPFSLSNIGRMTAIDTDDEPFNHATVLHGVGKVNNEIPYNFELRQDIKNISLTLGFKFCKNGSKYTTVKEIPTETNQQKKYAEA